MTTSPSGTGPSSSRPGPPSLRDHTLSRAVVPVVARVLHKSHGSSSSVGLRLAPGRPTMLRPRSFLVVVAVAATFACRDASVSTEPSPVSTRSADLALLAPNPAISRTDLGTLGGVSSFAADINNDGTVVGWSQNEAGATHAFRWTEGAGMVDLGTLPGDDFSQAIRILRDGRVLGVSSGNGHPITPVVWSASGSIRSE